MWLSHIAFTGMFILGWVLFPFIGVADRIVLKDGTVEESERIWTSDKFIHFILKGTQSVEIRYAIDIVERIERDSDAALDTSSAPLVTKGGNGPQNISQSASRQISGSANAKNNAPPQGVSTVELRRVEREGKGIRFYDPRRSYRYKTSKTATHNDLQSAINELAKIYGRSPDWVAAHMGEENDIQLIHQNLINRRQAETASRKVPVRKLPSVNSIPSPLDAQPDPLPESFPPKPSLHPIDDPALSILNGIKFYDPRRERKYWTARSTHHDSLKKALENLARQYDTTPKWIEDHMGESNLLIEIHGSIRSSLPRE